MHEEVYLRQKSGASCREDYDSDDIDLPCWICEQVGECLSPMFMIEGDENPKETLGDISTKAIRLYLGHLIESRRTYQYSPSKNWEGRIWREVIKEKIDLLEKILAERND